jgi:hypothetical protein
MNISGLRGQSKAQIAFKTQAVHFNFFSFNRFSQRESKILVREYLTRGDLTPRVLLNIYEQSGEVAGREVRCEVDEAGGRSAPGRSLGRD